MEDVHQYAKRVERYLERIKTFDMPQENKELLAKFALDCYSERLSHGRVYKLLYHMVKIAHLLQKDFRAATIDDLKRVMLHIEGGPRVYTENTKKDFRVAVKKFYKWLNGGTYPDIVKWMKATIKRNARRLPEDFPTETEIRNMVNVADNPRDKAFVLTLYESGCRIGELLGVKLKDLAFDKYGIQMMVMGKTGARRIRLILACDYVRTWLENHPKRLMPDADLWVTINTNGRGQKLQYVFAREMLRKLARRCSLQKKVNPHSFRHARATHLANRITESQLKEFFGWTQSSAQAATYVHLSGKNVDDALLRLYGMKEKNEEDTILCPRCKISNDSTARYCLKCGLPFGVDVALKAEQERTKYNDLMSRLMEDEEVRNVLSKAIQKLSSLQS